MRAHDSARNVRFSPNYAIMTNLVFFTPAAVKVIFKLVRIFIIKRFFLKGKSYRCFRTASEATDCMKQLFLFPQGPAGSIGSPGFRGPDVSNKSETKERILSDIRSKHRYFRWGLEIV